MKYNLVKLDEQYSDLTEGLLVAVNVFGEPFFNLHGVLIKISPETGDTEDVGENVDVPFDTLADYWTGASLQEAWEDLNEPVGPEHFLVPITPFALGGEFEPKNLIKVPIDEAIEFYRTIRSQIAGAVDGTKVSIQVKK